MKKVLSILLLLATLTLFGQQNLIKNGGFENELQYWGKQSENGADARYINDPRNKQIGRFSLKVNVLKLGKNLWDTNISQKFFSKKGIQYKVSLLAKTRYAGKKIRLQVQNSTYTSNDITLTNQWQNYSWVFTAKEDNLEFVIQYIQEGTFFIDDIIIKQVGRGKSNATVGKKFKGFKGGSKSKSRSVTSAVSIIDNGNFESGLEGWKNEQFNGAAAKFEIDSANPYEGKNAMIVTTTKFGPNTWDAQSVKKINVRKNKSYKLSFYARVDGLSKSIKIQIQDNTNKEYLVQSFKIRNEWKKHEWSFTAKTNTMEIGIQHISKGTMYFDDITFEPIAKIK